MSENKSGKPSASKTTKKVSANKNVFAGFNSANKNTSSKKSTAKKSSGTAKKATATAVATGAAVSAIGAVKAAKKMGGRSIAVIIICFILALAVGAGVCFFIGKNDKFDMVGKEQVALEINQKYTDEGVDIKEFGINLSNKAIIDTDLQTDAEGNYYAESAGDYYIAYTVKSLKFGFIYPIQKIRLISVVGASEGGE